MKYGKKIKRQWKQWKQIHFRAGNGGYDRVPLKEFAKYHSNSSTSSRWFLHKQMNTNFL